MTREPFEFRFELAGLPPSANTLVRPARIGRRLLRLVKTRAAAGWLSGAQLVLQAAWRRQHARRAPIARVPLELRLHFVTDRVSADVTNRVKALEDALTGIAWVDDCQVVDVTLRKQVGRAPKTVGVVRVAAGVDAETQVRISKAKKAGGT